MIPLNYRATLHPQGFLITAWVEVELAQFVEFMEQQGEPSESRNNNSALLAFIAQATGKARYGAGLHYELWEERRQDTLDVIIKHLAQHINEEEMTHFEKISEYNDNPDDRYPFICQECGCRISAWDRACSFERVGQELCACCCYCADMA